LSPARGELRYPEFSSVPAPQFGFSIVHYHLLQYSPHPKMHGVRGFNEIMDSVAWGLEQLGHGVSRGVNQISLQATNIVFGSHLLPIEVSRKLPEQSIVYNLEQARNLHPSQFTEAQRFTFERFELWEYSPANMPTWAALSNKRVKLVPIGYSPNLTRIPKAGDQDIDVLLYGNAGRQRMAAVHLLSQAGFVVVFVCGLYGTARDELISRSKLVLNVNLYEETKVFETVRVSYLLANRKAVIATRDANTYVDEDMGTAIAFTTLERLVDDCRRLLDDGQARAEMEDRGFAVISRRDIRNILRAALPEG
jgi:rhodanese-related sulfurtransferase